MRSNKVPDETEIVAQELNIPWSIEFSPEGVLYFTERTGTLNKLENDLKTPLLNLKVSAKKNNESGLLGLAFSPNYSQNHFLYLYYTYSEDRATKNRVSRFRETENNIIEEKIIIDNIPGARVHNGGRIKFGPDNHLYITAGEIWERERAQNLKDLGGKILRITEEGEIPKDNPWKDSPIYSYGNRNPQGLAWHPITGALFSSEHGPSGEQSGWRANDEINIIMPGGNYGWPRVYGSGSDPEFIDPLIFTGDDTWAPSGICFYTGDKISEWKNCLLVANLRGNHLKVVHLKTPQYISVEKIETYYHNVLGRLRDVQVGPDGNLYLCTSNTDGRGQPNHYDDLILRIVDPPQPDSSLLYD